MAGSASSAKHYAQVVFQIARESNTLDAWQQDLAAIVNLASQRQAVETSLPAGATWRSQHAAHNVVRGTGIHQTPIVFTVGKRAWQYRRGRPVPGQFCHYPRSGKPCDSALLSAPAAPDCTSL